MSQSTDHMATFCKESNKLVRSTNFLAWKKGINLALIENEVMQREDSRDSKVQEGRGKSTKDYC